MNQPARSDASPRSSGSPRAAVFDCDGLLIDSAASWRVAYTQVAAFHGGSLDGSDLEALAGASIGQVAHRLEGLLGCEIDAQRLHAAIRDAFVARRPALLPGVRRVLEALTGRMPLAVATNAPLGMARSALTDLAVAQHFDRIISADACAAPKPAPDVYLAACGQLGVAPSSAVAFEDSPLGVAAARAAGVRVVAIPSTPRAHLNADILAPRLDAAPVLRLLDICLPPAERHG